jgi:hypothetical protein
MAELPAPELPPDGSVWVVDSADDLEGREVEVKTRTGPRDDTWSTTRSGWTTACSR